MNPTPDPGRPVERRPRFDVTVLVLAGIGAYLVGLSLVMLVAPGTFFSEVGPFGVRNDHYIRDAASFQLALGILALLAAAWREVRPAAVIVIGLQFFLHALNHLIDIDEADPRWVGAADFLGLAGGCVVLGWLFWRVRREAG